VGAVEAETEMIQVGMEVVGVETEGQVAEAIFPSFDVARNVPGVMHRQRGGCHAVWCSNGGGSCLEQQMWLPKEVQHHTRRLAPAF